MFLKVRWLVTAHGPHQLIEVTFLFCPSVAICSISLSFHWSFSSTRTLGQCVGTFVIGVTKGASDVTLTLDRSQEHCPQNIASVGETTQ